MVRKKKSGASNPKTIVKYGAIPLPLDILRANQQMRSGFDKTAAFMAMVYSKFSIEVYRETVALYQRQMSAYHQQAQANAREVAERINRQAISQLESRTVEFSSFRFYANLPRFTRHMEKYVSAETMYFRIFQEGMREFLPEIKFTLIQVLNDATRFQHDAAFPERYTRSMLYLAGQMKTPTPEGTKPYFAGVSLPNLEKVLGNSDELSAAYHHKALLDGGYKRNRNGTFRELRSDITKGRVLESSLKTQNPRRRYLYWKAVSEGKQYITYRTTDDNDPFGEGQKRQIPLAGSWDNTITARLYVWNKMGKAPQWLLLEYGQPKYRPAIKTAGFHNPPRNITGEWVKRLRIKWEAIVRRLWDKQIELFNNTPIPPDLEIAPNISIIQPKYTSIQADDMIRITSKQYGTSYITYAEYLDRKVNQFFQLGDKWVRSTELQFYRMRGKYRGYIG